LHECALGVVTDKATKFIKAQAEEAEKAEAKKSDTLSDVVLQPKRWVPVTLEAKQELSEDTKQYTFRLPKDNLGLKTCQHLKIGIHMKDRMLIRSYTPTKPLLPATEQINVTSGRSTEAYDLQDGQGTFDIVVKTYYPSDDVPGGAMSNILDCIPIGEQVDVQGPTGEIVYQGQGKFEIEGKIRTFKKISLVLGGSGITPGFALIARVVATADRDVGLRVVDANKTEKDILLREQLDSYEKESRGRVKITHVLSHLSDDWRGIKGHVNAEIIKQSLFPPDEAIDSSVVFLCGPPGMIQKAALPALKGECCNRNPEILLTHVQTGAMLRTTTCLASDAYDVQSRPRRSWRWIPSG
jgi:nitrate reductase (NAD(P)H)